MSYCDDCIHKSVCYRIDSVSPSYADKCGDFASEKTGHWVERRSRATGHIESVCSECGAEEGYPYNDYCGNCGAKMESER